MPAINQKKISSIIFITLMLVISAFAIFLNFFNLGKNTPHYPDESIYSLIDIRDSVNDNMYPAEKNDLPHFFKPPLKSWLQKLALNIFGVNGFSLRLMSALLGLVSLIFLYQISYELSKNRWAALLSVFIFMTFYDLYRDYWSRMNGYDTGFFMGMLILFWGTLRYYEKKWYPFLAAFGAGFAFYYKHIAVLIALFIVYLYLLIKDKKIFNRKFIYTILIFCLLVALWLVPYFLAQDKNISYFIRVELIQRISGGFSSQPGYHEPLAHINNIQNVTGKWFLWVPLMVILYILFNRKNREYATWLFPLLWFAVPLALLSISASRLVRYMFPFYPGLAIFLGTGIILTFQKLYRVAKEKNRIRIPAFCAIFILSIALCFTSYNSAKTSVKVTEPHLKTKYHLLVDIAKDNENSRFLISKEDFLSYSYPEQVVTAFIRDKLDFYKNDNTLVQTFNGMGDKDILILFRGDAARFFFSSGENLPVFEDFSFIEIPRSLNKYNSTRKIAVFRKSSIFTSKLLDYHIDIQDLSSWIPGQEADDKEFMRKLYRFTFAGGTIPPVKLNYYLDRLRLNLATRDQIINRFGCYAKNYNPENYPNFVSEDGKINKANFQLLTDGWEEGKISKLLLYGFDESNLTPNISCYMINAADIWQKIPAEKSLENLLTNMNETEVTLIPTSYLLDIILEKNLSAEGRYSYFIFKAYRKKFETGRQYISIIGIVKNGGWAFKSLKVKRVELITIKPLEQMIPIQQDDSEKFIKDLTSLTLGCALSKEEFRQHFDSFDSIKILDREFLKLFSEKLKLVSY
ncbi:MAG: glycosyltransferase family 39 protein [Acidobacteria bacterium]|nr:glycosyltransferase family 39 protein [Acidobacteriota bacterium]